MSQIPVGTQFVGVIPSKDLTTKKSGPASREASAYTIEQIADFVASSGGVTNFFFIDSLSDLPAPSAGVITLDADTAYYFTTTVDLLGARLVGQANTTILGSSSETSIITSTGLAPGVPLFYSEWTTPIRHISFNDVDTAIEIQGTVNGAALDWTGVNFVNVPNVGLLNGGTNWIFSKGAFLNSQNLVIDGTWGTIGIDNSLFSGTGSAGTLITVNAGSTITRRFRMVYSAVVAFGSTVGINVNASATIPIEGNILDTVSFSGGGTYLSGLIADSIYSLFSNCTGIVNTYEISNYYMNGNATITDIVTTGVPVKIAGATTSNPLSQKFTNTNNRTTYNGGVTRLFNVTVVASITSASANDQIGVYVAKNGTVIPESETYITTGANNRAENVVVQALTSLSTNDFVEVWIENASDNSDVTVTDLNFLIKSLK